MSEAVPGLQTERLTLRAFTPADFDAFAAIWGDERVTRHISGAASSRSESWTRFLRLAGLWPILGYGYWAVEARDTGALAGLAGFADFKRDIEADIDGLPEAGWVFAPAAHGKGYATEAMGAALAWLDARPEGARSCCLINPANAASIRVADKLGYGDRVTARFGEGESLVFFRSRGAAASA
ncbi:MAG: GNAT family N-acetyltransferase [Oceanicaulis sp.]